MLKISALPEKLTFDRLEIGDVESGDGAGGVEIAKKLRKLKGQKLAKFKKPLKSKDLPNFNIKNSGPSSLIPKTRAAFNRL